MNAKTRSLLKALAVLIVLLAVIMYLQVIIIPALTAYTFWLAILGFALLLISSR